MFHQVRDPVAGYGLNYLLMSNDHPNLQVNDQLVIEIFSGFKFFCVLHTEKFRFSSAEVTV